MSGPSTLTSHGEMELQEAGDFNNIWRLSGRTLVNAGSGRVTGEFWADVATAQMNYLEGAQFQNQGTFTIENAIGLDSNLILLKK